MIEFYIVCPIIPNPFLEILASSLFPWLLFLRLGQMKRDYLGSFLQDQPPTNFVVF